MNRIPRMLMDSLMNRRATTLAKRLAPHLGDEGPILDIGAGTGHNVEVLREKTGLEFVEADVANINVFGRPPIVFDGQRLPFDTGSFSCSVMLFVLHYVERPVPFLWEVHRVTRTRVVLLQSTYHGPLGLSLLRVREFLQGRAAFHGARAFGLIPTGRCPLTPHRFFTQQRLESVLRRAGFVIRLRAPEQPGKLPVRRDLYVLEKLHDRECA